jgi:hypothetical protein
MLRNDATVRGAFKKQHVIDVILTLRFNPMSSALVSTLDARPLLSTVAASYESVMIIGAHAFSASTMRHGYDVEVPPHTLTADFLPMAIAAMPGELPSSFRVWVLNEQGEVVPADIQVVGRKAVTERAGPRDGTCEEMNGKKEKREAVTLKMTIGTKRQQMDVLAAAPHLKVDSGIKCRIARQ